MLVFMCLSAHVYLMCSRSSSLHLANPGLSPSGVASSYSCSSMTHLHTLQGNERPVSGPPASDNNNEDFSKTTVCLSEPNTPQHRCEKQTHKYNQTFLCSRKKYRLSMTSPSPSKHFVYSRSWKDYII